MDAMNQQLFMFTRLTGVLDNIVSYNTSEIVFENGSIIRMDQTNEIISIENHNSLFAKNVTMSYRECTLDKLKEMGFIERTHNRHSQSYETISIKFDK